MSLSLFTIISIALLVYVGLFVLINALKARKREWYESLIRTAVIIVSAVIACLVTVPLSGLLGGLLMDTINSMLGDLAGMSTTVPLLEAGIVGIANAAAAPFIFVPVFYIVRIFVSLIAKIPSRILKTVLGKKLHIPFLGILIGAVNGALTATLIILPICGYITLADNVITAATTDVTIEASAETGAQAGDVTKAESGVVALSATSSNKVSVGTSAGNAGNTLTNGGSSNDSSSSEDDSLVGFIHTLASDHVIKASATIWKPAFRALTTISIEAEGYPSFSFVLEDELCSLARVTRYVTTFMEDMDSSEISDDSINNVRTLSSLLLDSEWILNIAADLISGMGSEWAKGNSFAGMDAPEPPELFKPTFDVMMELFSTVTVENLEADMNTFLDVVYYINKADLLEGAGDADSMMKRLGEGNILSNIITTIEGNKHLEPLADEISNLGMRVVASSIGKIEIGADADYDIFLDDVASTLNDSLDMSEAERDEYVQGAIQTAFVDYGVDVPEDVAVTFSHKLIKDLGSDGEITENELNDYLDSYVVVTDEPTDSKKPTGDSSDGDFLGGLLG